MIERMARRWGMAPWDLERAADADPAVMRWVLLEPHLAGLEAARRA